MDTINYKRIIMNLISSKDFRKFLTEKSDSEYRRLRENFDNFLEKPLKLGYFIPCDENDVPLEEPSLYFEWNKEEPEEWIFTCHDEIKECVKYQEAKQKVIFEGFEYDKENDWVTYNEFARFFVSELQNGKVEDLFKLIKDEITLTETSKKEIGYETT